MNSTDTSYFDRFHAECEARGVLAHPTDLPTRRAAAEAAREEFLARFGGDLSPLRQEGLEFLIEDRTAAGAPERHAARAEAAREALLLAADAALATVQPSRPVDDLVLRPAVAMLLGLVALRGSGGPGDLGGASGASALPILPWIRHRSWTGQAWVSALREAIHRLLLDATGIHSVDAPVIELNVCPGGDIAIGFGPYYFSPARGLIHPEVWRLLDSPAACGVDGEPSPVEIRVPGHPQDTAVDLTGPHPLDVAGAISVGRRGRVRLEEVA